MGSDPGNASPAPGHGTGAHRHVDFVILLLFVAGIGSIAEALAHAGWKGGTIVTGILTVAWLAYARAYENRFLFDLWFFGIVAGCAELVTDCEIVHRNILVYAPGGPFIACSPLYMPFGWATELAEFTYLARFLLWHFGLSLPVTMLLTAGFSALQMPLSEYLARSADLWHYQNVPMAFGTVPYLIISTEFLFALPLPLIARFLHRVKEPARLISMWWAVAMGALVGVWIQIAAWVSLLLFS